MPFETSKNIINEDFFPLNELVPFFYQLTDHKTSLLHCFLSEFESSCWQVVTIHPTSGAGLKAQYSCIDRCMHNRFSILVDRPLVWVTRMHLFYNNCYNYTPPGWDLYCSPCRLYGPTYRSPPIISLEEVMWQVSQGGYVNLDFLKVTACSFPPDI